MLVGYLAIVFEASPQEEFAIIINIMMEMMIDILSKIYRPTSIIGEGNGHPLQYSCLENPMDGGAWQATVHRVAELDTTERLDFTSNITCSVVC